MRSTLTAGGESEVPASPATGYRVIQIHPTLRCNLFCKHCYSSSSPAAKGGLDLALLKPFLEYAYGQGFNAVSISGGEPFLYEHLLDLLTFTKSLGYHNLTATNGMLLKSARARACLDHLDLVAVSIDGPPLLHDDMRGLAGAFDKTLEGLAVLREQQCAFGLIHTLTNESWRHLLWLGELAVEQGARLLQLHPLELYGRATAELSHAGLTQTNLHRAYILGKYLQSKYGEQLLIQLDFLHRHYIMRHPDSILYEGPGFQLTPANFAEYIQTLIIDEQGRVMPVSYGFAPYFTICELASFRASDQVFEKYLSEKGADLYGVMVSAHHDIVHDYERDLVAWAEYIVRKSYQAEPKVAAL